MVVGRYDLDSLWYEVGLVVVMVVVNATEEGGGESGNLHLGCAALPQGGGVLVPPPRPSRRLFAEVLEWVLVGLKDREGGRGGRIRRSVQVHAHLDMVTHFVWVLLQPQRFFHPYFSLMAWLRPFLYGGAGFG